MKRSASLDFLRGAAAFAVAIPHFVTMNAPFRPLAEATAIAAVEVFFVLSGFVLAPQIVDWVVGRSRRNLAVFLARRWMRTIPPYLVALAAVAALTGNLLTGDCLRYLLYLENLDKAANYVDFYPVAWSLAVEEWFYLLFAPMLFAVGWLLSRSDRRMEAGFAVLVILAVAALRFAFSPDDWDLNVRRVTIFRIDSIVWGFLLYLAFERWRPSAPVRRWSPLAAVAAIAAVATVFELWIAILAVDGSAVARRAFPYSSAIFGMALVGAFRLAELRFNGAPISGISFYLGRISYSVYLFHVILILALKPLIGAWPLGLQLAVYLLAVCGFSTIFWSGFERPLLAARPNYPPSQIALRPDDEHSTERLSFNMRQPIFSPKRETGALLLPLARRGRGWSRLGRVSRLRSAFVACALGLGALGAGVLTRSAFMANRPAAFYVMLLAAAILAIALAERLQSPFARGFGTAARALFLFALALPLADFAYRVSNGLPLAASTMKPTYSYRAAHENPAAFAMWWFYYLNEWIRSDGIRRSIEMPDPEGTLPFVLIPGGSARMFDTVIKINNFGFRGPDMAQDKGRAFRMFALGESQIFGPTLHDGEKPWPELLQGLFDRHASCGRRIEVVNAGTEAYTLEDNLERMRRDILPLKPDLILSAHGMNGLLALGLRRELETNEPGVRPRASPLIARAALTIERAVYDWRSGGAARARPISPGPVSDVGVMRSRYAEAYRRLIALSHESGAEVVLSTSAMAVNPQSPRGVKDFYGVVFRPIDDIIAANAAHNRMVGMLSAEEGVPLIDAAKDIDGTWDDDLYLDIVHFTERGNERMAEIMFRGLLPILDGRGVRCVIR